MRILLELEEADKRGKLSIEEAIARCLSQMYIVDAPVSFVIAAECERTTRGYRDCGAEHIFTVRSVGSG